METLTVTGLDLKLRRTAARLTQREIAARMGVKGQYVSQIEARAIVRGPILDRYVAALTAVTTTDAA